MGTTEAPCDLLSDPSTFPPEVAKSQHSRHGPPVDVTGFCPVDILIRGHQPSEPLPAPHLPLPSWGSGSTPAASPDLCGHTSTRQQPRALWVTHFCACAGGWLLQLCTCTPSSQASTAVLYLWQILQYGTASPQPRPSQLPVGLNLALFLVTGLHHSACARSPPDPHDRPPLPYMLLQRPCNHSTHQGLHSSCGPGLALSPVTDLHHQAHLQGTPPAGHLHASSLMANTSLRGSAPMVRACSHSNEC